MAEKEIRTDHSTWSDIVEDFGDWVSGGAIKKHERRTKEAMDKINDLPGKRAKNVKVGKISN